MYISHVLHMYVFRVCFGNSMRKDRIDNKASFAGKRPCFQEKERPLIHCIHAPAVGVHLRPHNQFQKRVCIDCDHFLTILFLKRRSRQKDEFWWCSKCRTIGSRLSLGENKRAQLKGKKKRKKCDALTAQQAVLAFRNAKERFNVNAQDSVHRRTNRECSICASAGLISKHEQTDPNITEEKPSFSPKQKFITHRAVMNSVQCENANSFTTTFLNSREKLGENISEESVHCILFLDTPHRHVCARHYSAFIKISKICSQNCVRLL